MKSGENYSPGFKKKTFKDFTILHLGARADSPQGQNFGCN